MCPRVRKILKQINDCYRDYSAWEIDGIVIKNTKKCVISSNTIYNGSIVEAIKILSDCEDNVISNNVI